MQAVVGIVQLLVRRPVLVVIDLGSLPIVIVVDLSASAAAVAAVARGRRQSVARRASALPASGIARYAVGCGSRRKRKQRRRSDDVE